LSKSQCESNEPVNCEHACNSKFKTYPPPTFSGICREWPEFRTVWRHYAAFEFQTEEERAAALRSSLRGAAFDCIKSIYSQQPNANERQWDKLERRYSDVSPCMQNVYKELSRSKPVLCEDHKALVHNVLDKSTAVKIEGSNWVSHGALKLQVQGNVDARENLKVLQEILPDHYLQSCSVSGPEDSSEVGQSVSGTSSSQLSGSQLNISQVKQEEGVANAEHPTTLLLQTPVISADDNYL